MAQIGGVTLVCSDHLPDFHPVLAEGVQAVLANGVQALLGVLCAGHVCEGDRR